MNIENIKNKTCGQSELIDDLNYEDEEIDGYDMSEDEANDILSRME